MSYLKIVLNYVKILLLFAFSLVQYLLSFVYAKKKLIRNQLILITGSGNELARNLACELSKVGVTLILIDNNEANNQATYDALRALKHRRMHLFNSNLNDTKDAIQSIKEKGDVNMVIFAHGSDEYCDQIGQEFIDKMLEKQGHFVSIGKNSYLNSISNQIQTTQIFIDTSDSNLNSQQIAKSILDGILRNKREIFVPKIFYFKKLFGKLD